MKKTIIFFTLGLSLVAFFASKDVFKKNEIVPHKVLICGVCRNVHRAFPHTVKNIEELGSHFEDYAVLIYENNSKDNTVELMQKWAQKNSRVRFKSETLTDQELPLSRTEKIARARNIVLEMARDPKYKEYKYLIMTDLDFRKPWPIEEIVDSINAPFEWDAITANGVDKKQTLYWDRYAMRNEMFPIGLELLGDAWWGYIYPFYYDEDEPHFVENYSGFGGMGIYKRETLLQFSYSGVVTKDLEEYYRKLIVKHASSNNRLINGYLKIVGMSAQDDLSNIPIIFQENTPGEHPANYHSVTCCEHVPLHAAMAQSGHGKFFINTKMIMQY